MRKPNCPQCGRGVLVPHETARIEECDTCTYWQTQRGVPHFDEDFDPAALPPEDEDLDFVPLEPDPVDAEYVALRSLLDRALLGGMDAEL